MFRGRVRRAHLVGAGGSGMSAIAEVLRGLGLEVSGSDLEEGETTARLRRLGVRVDAGHRASHVGDAGVVVRSSAVGDANPEIQEARRRGIPVVGRGEMLAELMKGKTGVAIAGSHGKTTTTALIATVLEAAGRDPTALVGGRLRAWGSNARLGRGELFVAEADESDGSFLRLDPTIAAVTNVDAEHLDHFGTHEAAKEAFLDFAGKVPFYGLAVLGIDDPAVRAMLPRIERRHVTFGLSPEADYGADEVAFEGLRTFFAAFRRGRPLGEIVLPLPGRHNVLNALAALAVADELDVPFETVRAALAAFAGVDRRFTVVAEAAGVALVDDYGHHPAEIRATLAAARRAYAGPLVVAFQPHRYSRTRDLLEELARAFEQADRLFVLDVYGAGEPPIEGISGEGLARAVEARGHPAVGFAADRSRLAEALAGEARAGGCVIALGAGDVNRVLPEVLARLRGRAPEAADEGR